MKDQTAKHLYSGCTSRLEGQKDDKLYAGDKSLALP
jgi:hypothetical protein